MKFVKVVDILAGLRMQQDQHGKRRQGKLSLKRKMQMIEEVETKPGKLRKVIAADFDVPPNTLSSIIKEKDKIREQFFCCTFNVQQCRVRTSKFSAVEDDLLRWFSRQRSQKPLLINIQSLTGSAATDGFIDSRKGTTSHFKE